MCKYSPNYEGIEIDNCCFGVKKGYNTDLKNVVYPPINQLDDTYETLKMSFYNGNLIMSKNIMNSVKNIKLHHYLYDFS